MRKRKATELIIVLAFLFVLCAVLGLVRMITAVP